MKAVSWLAGSLSTFSRSRGFMSAWNNRCPVVIVPTMYYDTPVDVFARAGVRVVIWANQVLRGAIAAMKDIAATIHERRSLVPVEPRIVPVSEVFRLQDEPELARAEQRYLPMRQKAAAGGQETSTGAAPLPLRPPSAPARPPEAAVVPPARWR